MICNSHDYIYAFTNLGRVFRTRVFELPTGSRTGRGQNLVNYFNFQDGEKITNILTISKDQEINKDGYLVFATANGTVKKTSLSQYSNVRANGIIAINLKESDQLVEVLLSLSDEDKVIISANNGKTVIFDRTQLNSIGRTAAGVRGIKLKGTDKVISLQLSTLNFQEDTNSDDTTTSNDEVLDKKFPSLLVITENGFAKHTYLPEFRKTSRAASGVKTLNMTTKTGKPVMIQVLKGDEENLIITTKDGITIAIDPNTISQFGRSSQGVKAIKLDNKDKVVSASLS